MPYAIISSENKVIRTMNKISPFDNKLLSNGVRVLQYTEPYYDPELDSIKIIEPVAEYIEILIVPNSNKLELLKKKKAKVIQKLLDTKAQELGYDSMLSAVSYATDPDGIFYVEAVKLSNWRSSCWATAYQFINTATIDDLLNLTDSQILNSMPILVL